MTTSPSALYPSTAAIAAAGWLRRFATALPAYAERYALTALEIEGAQLVAQEAMQIVIERMADATQRIVQRQHKCSVKPSPSTIASNLISAALIHALVRRIQTHPTYLAADGEALGLGAMELTFSNVKETKLPGRKPTGRKARLSPSLLAKNS